MHDQIGAEFVAAVSDENGYREQIQVASEGDERARETCEMNLLKIREGEGLPLELIQAINSLVESLDAYVATVCDYNRPQFRLLRAIGKTQIANGHSNVSSAF